MEIINVIVTVFYILFIADLFAVGSFLFHTKAELYSFETRKWRTAEDYPFGSSLHSAAMVYNQIDGHFYVIGGFENGGSGDLSGKAFVHIKAFVHLIYNFSNQHFLNRVYRKVFQSKINGQSY